MLKITSLLTAVCLLLGSVYAGLLPKAPDPVSEQELLELSGNIERKPLSDVVYVVDRSAFTEDEWISAIALQGIVAKTEPCIYFVYGGAYNEYLRQIERTGKKIIRTPDDGQRWTYKSFLSQFRDYISDGGYTLYENSEFAEGLNVATNFATAYGWLPVPVSAKYAAEECGLTMKKDLTGEVYDYDFQEKYFDELKEYFTKGTVVHVKRDMKGLRDLAVEQGYFCFYTPQDKLGIRCNAFLRKILRWSGKNTCIYGWCEFEKKNVKTISRMGCHIVPADHSYNNSFLSQFPTDAMVENGKPTAYTDETKHYATLVFSDGDNCQWIQNGYGEYFTMTGNYPSDPVSWTFSPTLKELCPSAFERTVSAAKEGTSFLCGPSGAGYCNPSRLDAKSLDLFSTKTASAMLKSGERVLGILDDYKAIREGRIVRSFDYFSRFDNIDGGILFLDPDRYEAGKGKVWFSNGKPFASVRLSLWATDGYDGATDEWIRQQAETVNGFPVDIHSVNGYSVICVHAWTMKPEALHHFIELLDDHVKILSADDFIQTMKRNLPHETAMLE